MVMYGRWCRGTGQLVNSEPNAKAQGLPATSTHGTTGPEGGAQRCMESTCWYNQEPKQGAAFVRQGSAEMGTNAGDGRYIMTVEAGPFSRITVSEDATLMLHRLEEQ